VPAGAWSGLESAGLNREACHGDLLGALNCENAKQTAKKNRKNFTHKTKQ